MAALRDWTTLLRDVLQLTICESVRCGGEKEVRDYLPE